jgi:hypothetical protein
MELIPTECLHFLFTGVSITNLGVMSDSVLKQHQRFLADSFLVY